MQAVRISSGPLRGVRLEVAQRRWGRSRWVLRSLGRRRRPAPRPATRQDA